MVSEKLTTPRQILAKAYRDNGDIGAANYIEGGSDLLPDTQVHLLAIQDALDFATTRAPADLRSALEAKTIERAERRLRFIAEHYGPGTSLSISDTNYLLTLLDYVRALAPTKEPAA